MRPSRTCLWIAGVAAGLTVLTAGSALAWGDDGHRVIAYIANAFLTPAARAEADVLLRSDTDPLTARDMASRATWADRYRTGHPETAPWHYIDIDYDHPDLKAACGGGQCLPAKIGDFERVLANPAAPISDRAQALVWLLHLVGDVHQPLHTINRHDRGGNCEVIETSHGLESLHKWWDDDVVDAIGGRQPAQLGPALAKRVSKAELAEWSRGTADDWAAQSYQIARTEVYAYTSDPHCKLPADTLSSAYVTTAEAIATRQLERAGVRLAAVLNAALAPGTAPKR